MSSYNGVGYSDQINGASTPSLQSYLYFPGTPGSVNFISQVQNEIFAFATPVGLPVNDSYITSFIQQVGLPSSLDKFIVQFREFMYVQGAPGFGIVFPPTDTTILQKMATAHNYIANVIGQPQQFDYQQGTSFWSSLVSDFITSSGMSNWTVSINSQPAQLFSAYSAADQNSFAGQLLLNSFSSFASHFQPDTGSVTPVGNQWANGFSAFLGNIVGYNGDIGQVITNSGGTTALSLQGFYDGFLGSTAQAANFDQFFADFVTKQGLTGFANPTVSFANWTQAVVQQYLSTLAPDYATLTPSSVANHAEKTFILNSIFSLLVQIIGALQKVAAAQANRLVIFGKWQQAYTELQNAVRFVNADDNRFHPTLSGSDTRRQEFNSDNTSFTDIIKANASNVSDDAKALQTQINQSTNQVDQQTSMATAILQQLQSIFAVMYK